MGRRSSASAAIGSCVRILPKPTLMEYHASHCVPRVGKSALAEERNAQFDLVDHRGTDRGLDYWKDHERGRLWGIDGHYPGYCWRHHWRLPHAPRSLSGIDFVARRINKLRTEVQM